MHYRKSAVPTRLMFHIACAAMLILFTGITGCDDDDDDYDHNPPAGQGSLIVENKTDNHMAVYVDGARLADAREGHHATYDLDPGDRRLVLDEHGGDRTWSGTIDILEGRLTIMDVVIDVDDHHDYDVFTRLD